MYPLPDYGYYSVYGCFATISLEQTRLCPNNCIFFGKAKVGHGSGTMNMDDLHYVLDLIPNFSGWVGVSGSGEPLMLNDLPERIALIKQSWPKCHLEITTTLNIWRGDEYIRELFSAGSDLLIISCYGYTSEDYERLHGSKNFSCLQKNLSFLADQSEEIRNKVTFRYFHNVENIVPISDANKKREIFLREIAKNRITHLDARTYFPWECGKQTDTSKLWELPAPCDVVWGNNAKILNIRWNLDVIPCCLMSESKIKWGNLRRDGLKKIFTSDQFQAFQKAWWEMRPSDIPICNSCKMYNQYGSKDELARMAAWQAESLQGMDVVFWGAGEAYRAYRTFFSICHPVAMLVDTPCNMTEIDGIPIYHPKDFLPKLKHPLPLVIFAMHDACAKIAKTLKTEYPSYIPTKLVTCPATALGTWRPQETQCSQQ